MKQYLVCIDRDGTINRDPGHFGKDLNWREQLELYPSVIEGIKLLNTQHEIKTAVISNQAGVARKYFGIGRVEEINRTIDDILRKNSAIIHTWQYCPFITPDYIKKKNISENLLDKNWIKETDLRKPGIGMLRKSAEALNMSLSDFSRIYIIGDQLSDLETAINITGIGILIPDQNNNLQSAQTLIKKHPTRIIIKNNFYEACYYILEDIKNSL